MHRREFFHLSAVGLSMAIVPALAVATGIIPEPKGVTVLDVDWNKALSKYVDDITAQPSIYDMLYRPNRPEM